MKMGVKEFRERFSEVSEGTEPVLVTKNGRVVGIYDPAACGTRNKLDWDALEAKLESIRSNWKARTPDWRERMIGIGFDEHGEDLAA